MAFCLLDVATVNALARQARAGAGDYGAESTWMRMSLKLNGIVGLLSLLLIGVPTIAGAEDGAGNPKCGNGILNSSEECDPGTELYCNGDPSQGSCRTGADCAGGVNCYFALSCCKFNCQFVGQGADCFDGNECTFPDRCNQVGECVGAPLQKGAPCDDGNFCTIDQCDGGRCIGTPGTPVECEDHDACTDDLCNPEGGCSHVFNAGPCDDGQLCTQNDNCSDGTCRGTPAVAPGCDDGNVCTDEGCDPTANQGRGACTHSNNTAPCNDAQFCTRDDVCAGGVCQGTSFVPESCSDGNICTDDLCSREANGGAGACVHPNNSAPCDDGQYCTVNDTCSQGWCAGGGPRDCGGLNVCIIGSCDEIDDACVTVPDLAQNGEACDDVNLCTQGDTCQDGTCSGAAVTCDDGLDCTFDDCNPALGCTYVATEETRDCADSCFDGINNDPGEDSDIDFEDSGCSTLAPLQRFAVVSTDERSRKALYSGGNVSVDPLAADGTCNLTENRCECPVQVVPCERAGMACGADSDCGIGRCDSTAKVCVCPSASPQDCLSEGRSCSSDAECITAVAGICDLGRGICQCPPSAPNCQAKNRICVDDTDCFVSPFPRGPSMAGVCGNDMDIRAGTHTGLITSRGSVRFGKGTTVERDLDLGIEFANSGGFVGVKDSTAPLVGRKVCGNNVEQRCESDATCGTGSCDRRRRLDDGLCADDMTTRCILNSDCSGGGGCSHPFVTSDGSSENYQRCAPLLTLDTGEQADPSQIMFDLMASIRDYVPAPAETVDLTEVCEACRRLASQPGDPQCSACAGSGVIRTGKTVKKVIVTVGSGLQVLDLDRIILAGKTAIVLRGRADTILVVRVNRQLRLGGQAKIFVTDDGSGNGAIRTSNVLWNVQGRLGGKPTFAGESVFTGTVLAPQRSGIRLGSDVILDGAIYSQKIHLAGPATLTHVPFTPLLPVDP